MSTSPSLQRNLTVHNIARKPRHDGYRGPVDHIFDALHGLMKRPDDEEKAFICESDVNSAWKNEVLSNLIPPGRWSEFGSENLLSHFKKILSIVVCIGASYQLSRFNEVFIDSRSGQPRPHRSDRDLPFSPDNLRSMGLLNHAQEKLFLSMQRRFLPQTIEIHGHEHIQQVDINFRLPFETVGDEVDEGAYGEVRCVEIPVGYLVRMERGQIVTQSYKATYACKKLKVFKDHQMEASNLKVLKESLATHKGIMLHEAVITHGTDYLILFPYALHRDLELFLHCGYDKGQAGSAQILYPFAERFPKIQAEGYRQGLLTQLNCLADALLWLHNGIRRPDGTRITFVHMDLKPSNILVDYDPISPVGCWKLSDFGISAVQDEAEDPAGTIGDVTTKISQLTVNTRPRRGFGTYQAPEIEGNEHLFDRDHRLRPNEQGIGRRSDVWSFGCIFCVVLAFALNKDKEVDRFADLRLRNANDDLFYRRKLLPLANRSTDTQFELRPAVRDWLLELPTRYVMPGRWIECAATIAFRILDVNVDSRPNADGLLKFMLESYRHYKRSLERGKSSCFVLDTVPSNFQQAVSNPFPHSEAPNITVPSRIGGPAGALPPHRTENGLVRPDSMDQPVAIKRTTTDREELLGYYNVSNGSGHPPGERQQNHVQHQRLERQQNHGQHQRLERQQNHLQHQRLERQRLQRQQEIERSSTQAPLAGESSSSLNTSTDSPARIESGSQTAGTSSQLFVTSRTDSMGSAELEPGRGLRQFWRPRKANGLVINPDCPRRCFPSKVTHPQSTVPGSMLSARSHVQALSLSPCGTVVGFLVRHDKISAIHVCEINAHDVTCVESTPPTTLLQDRVWDGIAVSGIYVGAWGHHKSDGSIAVCLVDLQNPSLRPPTPQHSSIASLKMIAVSSQGAVAYLCDEKIVLSTFWSTTRITLTACPGRVMENGKPIESPRSFSSAAFNDTGDFLYAWTFNGGHHHLYAWRTHKGHAPQKPDSEAHYISEQNGNPGAVIVPYNTISGSIVEISGKRFFPGHSRPSQVGGEEPFPRHFLCRPNIISNCIFQDHSMIAIEKKDFRSASVQEYAIVYGNTHTLDESGREVCKLESKVSKTPTKKPELRIIQDGVDCYIIICNHDPAVEIVRVAPADAVSGRGI